MQRIAAYLLERREGLDLPESRKQEGDRICAAIEAWLKEKGATGGEDCGPYVAEDGSDAKFSITQAVDGDRAWKMYRLDEVTPDGRHFAASLSVTVGSGAVTLFVTLDVGSVSIHINQIDVDPRCPKVVRDLLGWEGGWFHGNSQLRMLTQVVGFDAGEDLAIEIANDERAVPFVIVSTIGGRPVLPGLDDRIAYDLAGIANVYAVDEDASWALTDTLRRPLSCFSGGVRLYWPQLSLNDDPYRHFLWTASRLESLDPDAMKGRERFRRQLRRMIMGASAVSVVRPREIDEIQIAVAQAEFTALQDRAQSVEEFREIANLFSNDNEKLRRDILQKDQEIGELQGRLARLESEKAGLLFHLRQAKPEAVAGGGDADDGVDPDQANVDDEEPGPPTAGEVRFYKKVFSTKKHDVMVRVGDCGHNSWQGAAKADKAKKGIAKLEDGRDDWNCVQHCGKCTGGGMWRVAW